MTPNAFRRIALAQGLLRELPAPPPPEAEGAERVPPEPRREPAAERPAQG